MRECLEESKRDGNTQETTLQELLQCLEEVPLQTDAVSATLDRAFQEGH